MDNLYSMLEQAQTIINRDDMAFLVNDRPLNFASMSSTFCPLPSPSDIKPFAHKVNKSAKRRTWKKPKDKPKRPLSAYNLFFQHERTKIIAVLPEDKSLENDGLTEEQRRRKHRKTHGKIGFGDLARNIGQKWRTTNKSGRSIFEVRAAAEKARYKTEIDAWNSEPQTDSGESVQTEEKKKRKVVSISNSSTLLSEVQPDALTSQFAFNYSAQQAQLIQSMMNNQALAQFQQQSMIDANVYQALMASNSEHLLYRQSGNFQQPRRVSQPNSFFTNSAPQMNQLNMVDELKSSSAYTTSAVHQRRGLLSDETFVKESFFDDVADSTRRPGVFSDADSNLFMEEDLDAIFTDDFDSDANFESSMEEDLSDIIDDFDSEILPHDVLVV